MSKYIINGLARIMAGRYIAGDTLQSVVACHRRLTKNLLYNSSSSYNSNRNNVYSNNPNKIGLIIDYIDEGTNPELYNNECVNAAMLDTTHTLGYRVPIMVAVKASGLGLLPTSDIEEIKRAIDKLDIICEAARMSGNKVTIDAETVAFQPVVDMLTNTVLDRHMTRVYYDRSDIDSVSENDNKNVKLSQMGDTHIYKTMQMYRKDSVNELNEFISQYPHAGVKLVRGAYYNEDYKTGYLHDKKEDTDRAYYRGTRMLYNNTWGAKGQYIIASHNKDSVYDTIKMEYMKEPNYGNRNRFNYAQLLGMGDELGRAILRVEINDMVLYKYVPYGPLDVAVPYLVRRLYENWKMLKYIKP